MSTKPPGALSPDVARRVAPALAVARDERIPLYLVGGAVRDLLLQRPGVDVDLVVEDKGDAFASRVASSLGPEAALTLHRRFGTAVIDLANGERLDQIGRASCRERV